MSGFAGIQVDDELLSEAQSGSADAHEVLYRRFAPAVYTLALRIVADPAKAEDVLQETFIEIMRSIAKFRRDAALATWIRQIAASKALMLLRSAWERNSEMQLPDHAATGPHRVEEAMDLATALAALDSVSRSVVWLHDVEGYTHREIGRLTGQSISFSKSRLARAHRELRARLSSTSEPLFAHSVVKPC